MTNETAAASPSDIPKSYDPKNIEHAWYPRWEAEGFFQPTGGGEPFCIVIPPPNVTGYLHMGHALQHAVMDTLTRWRRMQGRRTLWLPGTDHAGIATQMVVERQLAERGVSRTEIGREAFERKVWEWREHSGGTIQKQMRLEGVSVDWTRERFTLDAGLSHAVKEVFVRLCDEGLIYRGAYMVNWSPKLRTAVSDLEVEMKEVKGKLYHIVYRIAGSDETVTVATTRPETMLGDTALAVNPQDERYAHLHGKKAILPIVGREIPIVADAMVETDFGTGVVKVTPAHDPNDFDMGKRHDLEFVTVIGKDAAMTAAAGEEFAGLDRYKAREKVVTRLEEIGCLAKVEDYAHKVGHCQRSGVVIEPLISDQWFLNVKAMAERAIQAVKDGRTRFIPNNWEKVFFDWLENIRPWCVSRQLWWGHRIPAWHAPDGRFVAARSEDEARQKLGVGNETPLAQDEDVLDTWFSSALWPFSTLGWPDETDDLRAFYPTSVLVTGFDIIFFWVARMMMFGLHFMDEVPFKTVFITGLVRDAQGQKMSKTKGNVIDPLDVFNTYGTDAVRFSLVSAVTGGNDIKLQETKMEAARNFANKIWNATRFTLLNLGRETSEQVKFETSELATSNQLADKWIVSRLNRAALDVNTAFEHYRLHDASQTLYKFFWNDFCDWYIEFSKPLVSATEVTSEVITARRRIAGVLEQSLRLLHPLMPFITEDLWRRLKGIQGVQLCASPSVCVAPYPNGDPSLIDESAERDMEAVIGVVTRIRNIRSEMNIAPSVRFTVYLASAGEEMRDVLKSQETAICRLARVETLTIGSDLPASLGFAAKALLGGVSLAIPLEGIIDPDKEKSRLSKEIAKRDKELGGVLAMMDRPGFLENAAPDVVAEKREQRAALEAQLTTLRETLAGLN
jgi:valyl-tRNA synthetase